MTSSYKNPYRRKPNFQYNHPLSSSLSTSSLLLPTLSICPRKKYSNETWYDFKSSNPELSEKVLHRMQANFYLLQTKGMPDENYSHLETCLLNCECKKNPFHKSSLIDLNAFSNSQSFNRDLGLHWTDEKFKKNLWAGQPHQTSQQTLSQYAELRKKQYLAKEKFNLSNNSNFLKGTGNFGSSAEGKFTLGPDEKQLPSMLDKNINKMSERQLKQSEKGFIKKSSSSTFGYRKSFAEIPQKITYLDRPFFFVKLGIQKS